MLTGCRRSTSSPAARRRSRNSRKVSFFAKSDMAVIAVVCSVDLEADGFDDFAVTRKLGVDEGRELFRRAGGVFDALLAQALGDRGLLETGDDFSIQPLHDRGGR